MCPASWGCRDWAPSLARRATAAPSPEAPGDSACPPPSAVSTPPPQPPAGPCRLCCLRRSPLSPKGSRGGSPRPPHGAPVRGRAAWAPSSCSHLAREQPRPNDQGWRKGALSLSLVCLPPSPHLPPPPVAPGRTAQRRGYCRARGGACGCGQERLPRLGQPVAETGCLRNRLVRF